MTTDKSYIIEIGSEPAGIVIAEWRGYRFFSAGKPYARLEGALFNSPRQAEIAAQIHRQRQLGPLALRDNIPLD